MKKSKNLKIIKFIPIIILVIPAMLIFTLNVMQIYADNNTISSNISFVNNCYIHSRYIDRNRDDVYVVEISFDYEKGKTHTYEFSIENSSPKLLYSALHQDMPIEKIDLIITIPHYVAKEYNLLEIRNGVEYISTYSLFQQDEEFIEKWVKLLSIQAELF